MSATDFATRIRVSDPKPAYCHSCYAGAQDDLRFVDFDAAHDGGTFVRPDDGALLTGSDDLHLCENCVRDAQEVLALKPRLHTNALREIKRLEVENRHWRDYARRIEATLEERPAPVRGKGR